jgi:hypothetical protein
MTRLHLSYLHASLARVAAGATADKGGTAGIATPNSFRAAENSAAGKRNAAKAAAYGDLNDLWSLVPAPPTVCANVTSTI